MEPIRSREVRVLGEVVGLMRSIWWRELLLGLRTVIYPAPDLERAKAWYASVVGAAPYFDEPFYVGFDVGGYELGLDPDPAASGAGPRTYWGVEDADAALGALRRPRGRAPHGGDRRRRRDPGRLRARSVGAHPRHHREPALRRGRPANRPLGDWSRAPRPARYRHGAG